MQLTNLTARATRFTRAEKAWSWGSCTLSTIGQGQGAFSQPSHIFQRQARVENPGRRAPFQ